MRFHTRIAISLVAALLLVSAWIFLCCSPFEDTSWKRRNLKAIRESLEEALVNLLEPDEQQRTDTVQRIKDVQDSMACAIQRGRWVRDSQLTFQKARFTEVAPGSCAPSRVSRNRIIVNSDALHTMDSLCDLLRGKMTTLVGPGNSYYLHQLWLHALTPHDQYNHDCQGAELCSWHRMCLASFTGDASYVGKPAPTLEELEQSETALLRFVLSDTLFDPAHSSYQAPTLNPYTGVQNRESSWLGRARSSQIVILNHSPISAPAWSYDGTPHGNWSFVQGFTPTADLEPTVTNVLDRQSHSLILDAALNVTTSIFLPSVLVTLRRIHRENMTSSSIVIWHGNWFVNPSCDQHGQNRRLRLTNVEDISLYNIDDPWVLYYNAQVYFQDILLAELLPTFNITYLPMSIPLDGRATGRPGAYGACLTYPPGSVGADALTSTFLGGLQYILNSAKAQLT